LRATLITLFPGGLVWIDGRDGGASSTGHALWAAWLIVPMLIGSMADAMASRATESQFRRAVLGVLAGVAALGVVRALWAAFS
jgi:hypothetical protein